ncbi:MAG: hypothetical protein OXF79_12905 [Chloroflexi bacterium]|nr:hypothetical protein [Chloroflexota bacterium]
MFPGKKTFFITWAVMAVIYIIVMVAGVPFLPLALGVAFWGWALWGVIGAISSKRRNG